MTGALAPLASIRFRRLVVARTINMLGNAVAPVALAFAVLDLGGSGTDLGLVVGARSLANVVLLLFGGVVADRLPRHLVLVGSSALAPATQFVVAVLVLTRSDSLGLLAGFSALNGAASAFAFPAAAALLPQTVAPPVRQQANAIMRLSSNAALVVGAAAGGLLVTAVGPGWGIAVDAASFLVAGALFAAIRVPPTFPDDDATAASPAAPRETPVRLPTAPNTSVWSDLRLGWADFTSRTWLWVVVAAFTVINACTAAGLGVIGPLVADATFGRAAWGAVLAAETVGLVVGGLIAIRLRVHRLLRFGMAAMALAAVPIAALGLTPYLAVLLPTSFLAGVAIEQFGVAWDTTMQQHVPADRLARVYSYDMLGSLIAIPLGEVCAGPLVDHFGRRSTLTAAAVLILAATVAALSSRSVRDLANIDAMA